MNSRERRWEEVLVYEKFLSEKFVKGGLKHTGSRWRIIPKVKKYRRDESKALQRAFE